MPHCTLEYTANVAIDDLVPTFLAELHNILIQYQVFELSTIKSRAIKHDIYRVGAGNPNNAFIWLDIGMLDGRALEVRQQIGKDTLLLLKSHFEHAWSKLDCSVTVDISEKSRALHFSIKNIKS